MHVLTYVYLYTQGENLMWGKNEGKCKPKYLRAQTFPVFIKL